MFNWLRRLLRKRRKKPVESKYITVTARITRKQKQWLEEMKERGMISSFSQFIRRVIDMCMTGTIYIEEKGVMQRTYMVRRTVPQQVESPEPVKTSKSKPNIPVSPIRIQLLKELKQYFKERRTKIPISQTQ